MIHNAICAARPAGVNVAAIISRYWWNPEYRNNLLSRDKQTDLRVVGGKVRYGWREIIFTHLDNKLFLRNHSLDIDE